MLVGHRKWLECPERFVHHLLLAWQARFLGSGTKEKRRGDHQGKLQAKQNFFLFVEVPHLLRDFEPEGNLGGDKEVSHRSKLQAMNTMEVVCEGLLG